MFLFGNVATIDPHYFHNSHPHARTQEWRFLWWCWQQKATRVNYTVHYVHRINRRTLHWKARETSTFDIFTLIRSCRKSIEPCLPFQMIMICLIIRTLTRERPQSISFIRCNHHHRHQPPEHTICIPQSWMHSAWMEFHIGMQYVAFAVRQPTTFGVDDVLPLVFAMYVHRSRSPRTPTSRSTELMAISITHIRYYTRPTTSAHMSARCVLVFVCGRIM